MQLAETLRSIRSRLAFRAALVPLAALSLLLGACGADDAGEPSADLGTTDTGVTDDAGADVDRDAAGADSGDVANAGDTTPAEVGGDVAGDSGDASDTSNVDSGNPDADLDAADTALDAEDAADAHSDVGPDVPADSDADRDTADPDTGDAGDTDTGDAGDTDTGDASTGCGTDDACEADEFCDELGECAARFDEGAECERDAQCGSEFCVDDVCCESACDGECLGCSELLTGAEDGACEPFLPGLEALCGCALDEHCDAGSFCNASSECESERELGLACERGPQCESGSCSEGVCCDMTCDGECRSCLAALTGSHDGLCSEIPPGTTTDCTCSGDGECRDGWCDDGACAPEGDFGAVCERDTQCAGGRCVDGFCCDATCDGECMSCRGADTGGADGECLPVAAGTDPAAECAADLCLPGVCNGLALAPACRITPDGTECRAGRGACDPAETCMDGVCPEDEVAPNGTICRVAAGGCDAIETCSSGTCPTDAFLPRGTESDACGPYLCPGRALECRDSCASADDCAPGHACRIDGTCVRSAYRVFVSSVRYDGDLGGLSGADAECESLATAAGIGGNWMAWLSTDASNAVDRLHHSTLPYEKLNGERVANDWADLLDQTLVTPIDYTETGEDNPFGNVEVWTGTAPSGFVFGPNCSGWTADSGADGQIGEFWSAAFLWTNSRARACGSTLRIYCFEQP